jgi:hypothetical protein
MDIGYKLGQQLAYKTAGLKTWIGNTALGPVEEAISKGLYKVPTKGGIADKILGHTRQMISSDYHNLPGGKFYHGGGLKTAGILGNIGEIAKDVGGVGMNVLKSKNPWVTNALWGAGGTAGISALMAPEGHRMEAAAKGIVPGAIGGLAYHGLEKGMSRALGSPEVNMGGVMGKPGWGKSFKALSGLDPELSRGQAMGSLARRIAPTTAALMGGPKIMSALGVNPTQQNYESEQPQSQYLQSGPFLAR